MELWLRSDVTSITEVCTNTNCEVKKTLVSVPAVWGERHDGIEVWHVSWTHSIRRRCISFGWRQKLCTAALMSTWETFKDVHLWNLLTNSVQSCHTQLLPGANCQEGREGLMAIFNSFWSPEELSDTNCGYTQVWSLHGVCWPKDKQNIIEASMKKKDRDTEQWGIGNVMWGLNQEGAKIKTEPTDEGKMGAVLNFCVIQTPSPSVICCCF